MKKKTLNKVEIIEKFPKLGKSKCICFIKSRKVDKLNIYAPFPTLPPFDPRILNKRNIEGYEKYYKLFISSALYYLN